MTKIKTYEYDGNDFQADDRGWFNLTKIGRARDKRVKDWGKTQKAIDFLKALEGGDFAKGDKSPLYLHSRYIEVKRGRYGGTWAHPTVASEFAGWVDPKYAIWVHETAQRVANADITLAEEIVDRNDSPEDLKRLAARAEGKATRKIFTSTLAEHGVQGKGFSRCTNAINTKVIGRTSREFRADRGLAKSQPIRDYMSTENLISLDFAEKLSTQKIKRDRSWGNDECEAVCAEVGDKVTALVAELLS